MSAAAPYSYEAEGGPAELDAAQLWALVWALRAHEARLLVQPKPKRIQAPAAGADWTTTVPAGTVWIPLSIYAEFVTSAVVANRFPRLVIGDGNQNVARISINTAQTATLTMSYSFIRGAFTPVNVAGSLTAELPLPIMPLPGGFTVAVSTTGLDVGDAWQNIAVYVLEVRERNASELATLMADLLSGAHVDNYPGLRVGL